MESVGKDGRWDDEAATTIFFSYGDREGKNLDNDEGEPRGMESGNENRPKENN